ncbi:MAG: glycosyl hydrolase 115 family protein [candidate division KSB1 bacterium]|nr:glycosyl hydrolase 115 family protein [candidate division KSB1 bacterium]MDZ7400822.1 glycosyl hydrolase 115 family protein [candidate division KSB1 bacterium]
MTHRNNKKLLPSTIQLWLTILLVSLLLGIALIRPKPASAKDPETFFSTEKLAGAFALSDAGKPAVLCASSQDYPGVLRVLRHFQADIERVTGTKPAISFDDIPEANEIVIIGTLGKSQLIDKLVSDNKLDVSDIVGRWEASLIQVIEHPFSIGTSALVIVGSDKRGTIFGMFDLSEKIGVSPWYWWADVPPKKKTDIYILPGRHILGPPKVKYRGIFINDEAPALSGWAYEKFGGFNAKFYEHVFELILRLKGNFLWPAMWGRAFYDDDPENPRLADEYGVVIGTSHHEPMMRAHDEWRRYGSGPWNYEKNEAKLRQFWTEGIRRMGNYESIVTLAMRGDGDEPMSEEANIELLQRIVKDQREILKEVTGKDITTIPQVWALYKEVQEYYDKGMRVPDDVTLLLCDDNWGNIRKLPKLDDPPRAGGYGIYYHYDYVGGPRNFKWLNTNQISRVWEQMHLAYEYDARQIWIVNVGDIKPMEFPISFFLDYAWNPEIFPAEYLPEYTRLWSEKQFGLRYAKEIAHILTSYTKFNSRRKPELLSPDTYSLVNYREAETVVSDYKKLEEQARTVYDALPAEYQDAFYQLVLHPVEACANLNELYVTVGKNRLYAKQGRAATNSLAEKAKQLFARDAEITNYYNKIMANGKWNHMMDQTHIGYTYWQQPETNVMPEVKEISIPETAEMGVAVEGSDCWWPNAPGMAILPTFDRYHQQSYYIELFNRGKKPFKYSIKTDKPWIKVDPTSGEIRTEQRLWVKIDWQKVPEGEQNGQILVAGPHRRRIVVHAKILNPAIPQSELQGCFIECNNYVSIEAEHYSRAVANPPLNWQRIPDLGRTLSGMTIFPVTAPSQPASATGPRLEFDTYLFSQGEVKVKAYLSPTLNFHNTQGLRYGISFDDDPIQVINIHENKTFQDWEESVRNNITVEISQHVINESGRHVLKFWMVDPGVVLQKLVVETGEIKPSYLGPPESIKM